MAQGGYQKPSNPASHSGVGKHSKRTDGRVQPQRAPHIQDSTDLQQGEGRAIAQGQRIAPLQRTPAPNVQPASGGSGGGGRPGPLPDYLMQMPTNRPMEPETEGLDMGPGAGSEVLNASPHQPETPAEQVLSMMVEAFGDQAAADQLKEMQQQRIPQAPMPLPIAMPQRPEASPEPPEQQVSAEFPLPEAEPDATDTNEPAEGETAGVPSPM